jgi:hypothetical protein
MFALFGPDRVEGDWLTSWTLLDLFLLLVFSLAMLRLYGWIPGLIAFAGFALTYHEPGSPRWTWFFLLIPVALLRVIGPERNLKVLGWWRDIAVGVLLLNLIPFAATQIQNGIYPQLEPNNVNMPYRTLFQWMDQTSNQRVDRTGESLVTRSDASATSVLNHDPMPQISMPQTGPELRHFQLSCGAAYRGSGAKKPEGKSRILKLDQSLKLPNCIGTFTSSCFERRRAIAD